MSRKQVHNTKEAVSYLLEELPSEDDGCTDLESTNDNEHDTDFAPNHYDLVEENPQRCHQHCPFLYKILTPVMIMLMTYQMM